MSDSDTQKTSTEKLFGLKIYHSYYIDFFHIREAISTKSIHINIRMFKMNQYITSEKTHFFIRKGWSRWRLRCISNFSYKNFYLFLFDTLFLERRAFYEFIIKKIEMRQFLSILEIDAKMCLSYNERK